MMETKRIQLRCLLVTIYVILINNIEDGIVTKTLFENFYKQILFVWISVFLNVILFSGHFYTLNQLKNEILSPIFEEIKLIIP